MLRRDLNLLQLPLWQKVPPLKEVDFELIMRRVDRRPGSPFGDPCRGTLHVPRRRHQLTGKHLDPSLTLALPLSPSRSLRLSRTLSLFLSCFLSLLLALSHTRALSLALTFSLPCRCCVALSRCSPVLPSSFSLSWPWVYLRVCLVCCGVLRCLLRGVYTRVVCCVVCICVAWCVYARPRQQRCHGGGPEGAGTFMCI